MLDVIQLFETLKSDFELSDRQSQAPNSVVEELKKVANEIDNLTKAVLDTIPLETALNSTRRRAELAAKNPSSPSPE